MVYITNEKKDVKMLKIAVKPISSVLNILTSLLWSIRVVAKKKGPVDLLTEDGR